MRPFLDFKKQFNIFLLLVFFVTPIAFSSAQSASDIRNQIEQKNKDIEILEKEIAEYQGELAEIGEQKNSLSSAIKELDLTKKKLVADISITQKKIDKTNLEIENLSSDIGDKESSISNNMDSIALGIRRTNDFEGQTMIETLLSEDDFTDVWNDLDNMNVVRDQIRNDTIELREKKTELEDTRAETIKAKNELSRLKTELSNQQKIVVQNTNAKTQLLKQTQNSEASYQKLLQDRIAKRDAFEKELQDYEAQLQFILDPSKLPSGGVLSWPLNSILVTSPYGPRWGGFHRGVDFRASVGTPVKAMSDGVVRGVGDTDVCCPGASYGKWIFIEYSNGLSSTFGHLSLISVREGQRVARGELVGYSGNTGSSTGPHLHVSLYVSSGVKVDSFASKSYPGRTLTQPIAATNAHLEPMYYLPPTVPGMFKR